MLDGKFVGIILAIRIAPYNAINSVRYLDSCDRIDSGTHESNILCYSAGFLVGKENDYLRNDS